MKNIEELKKKADLVFKELDEVIKTFDFLNKSFKDYENLVKPFDNKLNRLSYLAQIQSDVEWKEIPDYGRLLTIEEWIECVDGGGFIDYDGSGNYSDGKRMSNMSVSPSDVDNDQIMKNEEFTHIVWFNK